MADTKREIERKYESDDSGLPDLTGVAGVATVVDKGVAGLDAVYYDTPDERLAAAGITLRRRTGGSDAGWHLKLPVSSGVRDEIRTPLFDTLPGSLVSLVRARVRDTELVPVVRIRSSRDLRDLLDDQGNLLAEVSIDAVHAERLTGDGRSAQWSEIEVELADDADIKILDKVEKRLRRAGVRPSASASKLARALQETAPKRKQRTRPAEPAPEPRNTAGDHVLAYLRAQREAIIDQDPAVRRDLPDSVHQMRVATRRMRSTFKAYGRLLDRTVTDPIGEELKWLAGELGVDRDHEVLTERLTAAFGDLPPDLVSGPVHDRLRTWAHTRGHGSRRRLLDVLDGDRYLNLLAALDQLLAAPPLLRPAAKDPEKVLTKTVDRQIRKVSGLLADALGTPPGTTRDTAVHETRKKAKRARYAAEAALELGGAFKDRMKAMKSLQSLLGEHQDSVMARGALRDLAAAAEDAGESSFTYGVLYGREELRAFVVEAELPDAYERWCEPR